MSQAVVVRKVENKQDFKLFFEFPWTLYQDDDNWVPPLLSMRKEILDENKNPSWEYLEGNYYIAMRGNQTVGTIAAFVNKRHNEFHGEHIGWFGFFECFDDQEAATALLNTAADWAQRAGYDAIRGPQSFTVMEECGLLIDGFKRPILLMPYNPPYYQKLIENAGFGKVMDTLSFYSNWDTVNGEQATIRKRLDKVVAYTQKKGNIRVRSLERKNLKKEFELFRELYNTAWEKNWGFVPFTEKELDALVESLGMFFDPQLACFGYVGDEPAGFLLAVPDFGQVLQAANAKPGIPEPLTLVKALWHWKLRPVIDWVRVPLMGVKEEFRNRGVDLVMYHHTMQQFEKSPRLKHLDAGWVLETNKPMLDMADTFGMEPYKRYRFYEKSLK